MAKINTNNFKLSSKRIQIEKSNTKVLIYLSVAVVALVFSLVATQALWKQFQYQGKVLSLRNKANDQLDKNIKTAAQLQAQYVVFDTSSESIIGTNEPNSKVVLNALPSKYDFPALATSLENLMNTSGVGISSITGTDDQLNAEQTSTSPAPKEIPFTIAGKGSYASIQTLINNIEKSTRPIKINKITYKGTDGAMDVNIEAVTYYQPLKKLDLEKKVIKPEGSNTKTKTETTTSEAKN